MREKIKTTVTFKTKLFQVWVSDDKQETWLRFKKAENIQKSDCNLRPHQHDFYNSDLFLLVSRRAYDNTTHGWTERSLERLPEGVRVSPDGFLRTVEVDCWV